MCVFCEEFLLCELACLHALAKYLPAAGMRKSRPGTGVLLADREASSRLMGMFGSRISLDSDEDLAMVNHGGGTNSSRFLFEA